MDPIPTITVPIGAANLHSVLNWLVGQINLQFDNLAAPPADQTAPEAFSLMVTVGPSRPLPSGAAHAALADQPRAVRPK